MISVKNLKKNYGSYQALKDVSFQVNSGEVFGFLGKNGAGKSTTMNILTGLIGYDEGEIKIDGMDIKKDRGELFKKIGYLPETPAFYPYMNGYEYLEFTAGIIGYDKKAIKKRVNEVLEVVKLKDAAKRKIGGYSRGMQQRLGTAVAIFNNPKIVFLDEPTSALDPEGRMDMLDLIESFKSDGKTVFLSTHILSDVERVCDTICIVRQGEVALSGTLLEIQDKYIQPVFDVEFEKDVNEESIKLLLKGMDFLERVEVHKNKASIYVKDLKEVNNNIIKGISELPNNIVAYNMRKSTLEDIFIRMVK